MTVLTLVFDFGVSSGMDGLDAPQTEQRMAAYNSTGSRLIRANSLPMRRMQHPAEGGSLLGSDKIGTNEREN